MKDKIRILLATSYFPFSNRQGGASGGATYTLSFLNYLKAQSDLEVHCRILSEGSTRIFLRLPKRTFGRAVDTVHAQDYFKFKDLFIHRKIFSILWRRFKASLNLAAPSSFGQDWRTYFKSEVARTKPDVVIVSSVALANLLDEITDKGIQKCILTHNLVHRQTKEFSKLGISSPEGSWDETTETEHLSKADVLLAIQAEEAQEFRRICPDKKVILMPHGMSAPLPTSAPVPARILFVGSAWPPNGEGMEWFLQNIWPKVTSRIPHASLHIVGEVKKLIKGVYPNVLCTGFLQDLSQEYGEAELCILPLLSGTGLKIKLVEAIAFKRAIVGTSTAFAGCMDLDGLGGLLADDPHTFSDQIVHLLTDDERREELERGVARYFEMHFTEAKAFDGFIENARAHFTSRSAKRPLRISKK